MDINFYYVKNDYIDYLKKHELDKRGFTCVPNTIYSSREKFLFGAVFELNGINYFVPVSSKIKGRDNDILISSPKKNEKIGSLRFQYMIPVPNKCLILLCINDIPEEGQRQRIRNELKFCRKNIHKIKLQAQKTYIALTSSKNEKLKRNSCDFKLLEAAYIIYCHDNDLPLSEELQKKYAEITSKQPSEETPVSAQKPPQPKPQTSQKSQSGGTFSFSVAQLKENAKRVHEQAEKNPTPTNNKNKNKGSR